MTSETPTFEEALKKLEEIVLFLEKGNIPLEDAVKAYEQGIKLKTFCHDKLSQAQMRIEKITQEQAQATKEEA